MDIQELHESLSGYLDRVPLVEMVGWALDVDVAKIDANGTAYRMLGHLIEHVAARDQLPALIGAVQQHYPRAPKPVVFHRAEALALRGRLEERWPTVPDALDLAARVVPRASLPNGAMLSARETWFYAIVEACKLDRFEALAALATKESR